MTETDYDLLPSWGKGGLTQVAGDRTETAHNAGPLGERIQKNASERVID